jgi:site-specific DNA-cytosine methylase
MCFRASEVGAAHHRDRWFCVAFPSADAPGAGLEGRDGQPSREDEPASKRGRLALAGGTPSDGDASDTEGQRRPEGRTEPAGQQRTLYALAGGRGASPADPDCRGQQEHGQPEAGRDAVREPPTPHADGRCAPSPADSHSVRRQGRRGTRPRLDWVDEPPHPRHSPAEWWGEYAPAIHRWEAITGVQAPYPTEIGPRGGRRLTAVFAEWLMGIPGRVTSVPGLSRSQQLHKIGNGVVPHQAWAAYRLILLELLLAERIQLAA